MLGALAAVSAAPTALEKRSTVQGFDISHYQGTVNFNGAYSSGARFVIIKVRLSQSPSLPIFPFTPHSLAALFPAFF